MSIYQRIKNLWRISEIKLPPREKEAAQKITNAELLSLVNPRMAKIVDMSEKTDLFKE